MDCSPPGSSVHGDSPGKNTGVGSHALLQGILPTQGSNPSLSHCKQILYHLSHQGGPRILEWVVYPFSRGSSWPRNQTGVSWIAGGFFTSWATREAYVMNPEVTRVWESGSNFSDESSRKCGSVNWLSGQSSWPCMKIEKYSCLESSKASQGTPAERAWRKWNQSPWLIDVELGDCC